MDNPDNNIQLDLQHRTESIQQIDKFCQRLIAQKHFSVLAYEKDGQLVAHGRGFDPVFEYTFIRIDELKPLISEFDRILVRTDGYSFVVYCIKNCFDSDRKVTTSLEALREVGKTCLPYTATVNRSKLPVVLTVCEAGNSQTMETSHLKALKCIPGRQKVGVRAYSLNFRTNQVWTNAAFNGVFAGVRYMRNILASIANNEKLEFTQTSDIKIQAAIPFLTYAMLGVFFCVFVLELYASHSYFSPSNATLISFGAVGKSLVLQSNEWYRLIAAAFLHGGYAHILFNSVAFFISGLLIEKMLGRSWMFTIFILSAIGGGIAGMLLNSPNTFSVGASGGIMGLIAASFMISFRLPYGPLRTNIQMRTLYMFIPAILPIIVTVHGEKIDYAAHLGGSVVGFLLALVIYKSWSKDSPEPGYMNIAKSLGVVCGLMTVAAVSQATIRQAVYQQQFDIAAQLIPQKELSAFSKMPAKDLSAQSKHVTHLLAQYPNDPRSYYLQAIIDNAKNDAIDASILLNKALTKLNGLKTVFPNHAFEKELRLFLAKTLIDQSKISQARLAVLPVCGSIKQGENQWLTSEWLATVCKN